MIWVTILLTIFQLYLAFLVGYLLLLTAASRKAPRMILPPHGTAHQRFLILIPAHNEERLLPDLLSSLAKMEYPATLYQIHVVADNCSDRTAMVARQSCAQVHIRNDREQLGKGYALNWLLERLRQTSERYDAVVFLDADSIVSPNFLQVLSGYLENGARAIQAYYAVRDPGQSWAGSLRYAALAVLHFLRPLGRMALGCSAGLKGNGMVLSWDLMKHYSWSSSITEDIELHMALLLNGERVVFAPDAIVWGEMPDSLSRSTSQHMRWEQGRKQLAHIYLPRLLADAWQQLRAGRIRRAFLLCDAVMEYLEPPFSILTAATLLGLAASLTLLTPNLAASTWKSFSSSSHLAALNVLLASILLLGQGIYLFAGLRSVSAPKQVYLNILNAPRLIVWKTWQMFELLLGRGQSSWVRTNRNER